MTTIVSSTFGVGVIEGKLAEVLVEQTVDNGDGTATTTRWDADGRPSTETFTQRAQLLPRDAQLAALLAAKGVITEDEAADITGHPKERLVAEVEAWAAAEELAVKR